MKDGKEVGQMIGDRMNNGIGESGNGDRLVVGDRIAWLGHF